MQHPLLSDSAVVTQIECAITMPPDFQNQTQHPNRPTHGLAYSVSGTIEYHFADGKELVCSPHCMVYLPRECSYNVKRRECGTIACINFMLTDGGEDREPFCMQMKDYTAVERCFQTASQAWKTQMNGRVCRVRACLYELFSLLIAQNDTAYISSKYSRQLAETVRYIQEHCFSEEISVNQLVRMTDLSESYYRRMFKAGFGMSPLAYIRNLRVEYAKELLKNTACTVEQTAHLCGYSETAYFCRQFKGVTGMTAGEYRCRFLGE